MTTIQIAALFSITGTFVAWLIAAAVLRGYPYPFFRAWTGAYGCGALVAALEFLAHFIGRPGWLIVIEVGLTLASAALLLRTRHLLEDRAGSGWLAPAMLVGGMAYAALLVFLGVGFREAFALPAMVLTFSFFRLGISLLGLRRRTGQRGAFWPAIPLLLHGTLIVCAPLFQPMKLLWLGYWLVGLVDTLVGIGMIVFVLEETARQLRLKNSDLMTEQDRSNRYRLLAERAQDIILVLDLQGNVVEANHAATETYGYGYEELLTKSLWDLRAPETLKDLAEQLAQSNVSGIMVETAHIKKDGTRFPVEISARGMDLEGRRVVVSIIRDVSDRQRMEAMLREQNTRLLELDRLKGDFINAASHELRTPLTSIKGYAEFLEDEVGGPITPDQRAFVTQIQEGASRLQRIVDDMLDFARMEAGTFTLVLQEAEIGAVVAEEVSSLKPQAMEARITLEVQVPANPVRVRMDPRRVGQVLLNLVGNAIKFTPEGGWIGVRVVPGDDRVRVEVEDTGIGIAAENLSRLFEKFFQVDASTTRERGGAGLGLAISKALVEAHGGRMGVASKPGEGSTFWLELPLQSGGTGALHAGQGLQGDPLGVD